MHLHVDTMNATLVEFAPDGRVRFENEDWSTPTQQEIRALIHAAEEARDQLTELLEVLEAAGR